MALFEGLVFLLLVAALLLAASRRLNLPYPTLLAVAGVGIAFVPGLPGVGMDPHLALAIFVAPALLDAAYDTAPRDLRRLWVPLVVLAVGAVILTTAAVAFLGVTVAGLPVAAAVVLGAIVAPPDAAATRAILSQVQLPRRGALVVQGESLLNDATALLIFGAALATINSSPAKAAVQISLAAPGGLAFGLVVGLLYTRIAGIFAGTHSSIIVQFASTFGIWMVAERLHISPVLAVVAYAMVIAQIMPGRVTARDRVQSYAVWAAVVFVLNVLAFLFMGLQTHAVLVALKREEIGSALSFAGAVLGVVIAVRIVTVLTYHAVSDYLWRTRKPKWLPKPGTWSSATVLSWCGTRGVLTLATSLSLPADFPGRNVIVLAAMSVVLGTLIIQGSTLRLLIEYLGVTKGDNEFAEELGRIRARLIEAALQSAEGEPASIAAALKRQFGEAKEVAKTHRDPQGPTRYDAALARAVAEQRRLLHDFRGEEAISDDVFQRLQEELDWLELSALPARDLEVLET
jgi:CPA1 family monovalent cation:H+ antiporter